jgi:hypothetical protein
LIGLLAPYVYPACQPTALGPRCPPMRRMFIQTPMLTGYASIRHVEVSLPFVAELIDGEKYYMEPKRLEGTELRRHRARGPTLRSLVKLALACDSAEEMGKKLKRRFDRSYQRQGLVRPGRARTADRAAMTTYPQN